MKRALRKISRCLLNAAVNFDRMCASIGGAPVDYTISGEAGKHKNDNPIAHATDAVLDHIQNDHCEVADAEDRAVSAARTEFERKKEPI